MSPSHLMFKALFIFSSSGAIYAASYSVPAPADLGPQAFWDRIEASAKIESNLLTIEYRLPDDLIGKDKPCIIAKGAVLKSSFIPVAGDNVEGYCMQSAIKPLTCMLKYPSTVVDSESRDKVLASHYSGIELELRSKVARLFGADPAGLLSVELK